VEEISKSANCSCYLGYRLDYRLLWKKKEGEKRKLAKARTMRIEMEKNEENPKEKNERMEDAS